ncbi:MAG: NADH-quinone oxidoreductase subunit M [Candidatus Omnitrophica bacterium]|nr:NADH-quinone oxidoreductase subunit M [bacterium]MBV6480669.1 NAD(P)H-quinone oxidoreductase chain 4 1 [bacterium]MCC6732014.1 NADH-quinone oxidoreductase subunit M [Candidatus Omnitrophota bacterium]MCE7907259.1 NADH-quinone oxidoreductase subunit M [Candidatus Omnitrophica bacterium COP1]
MFSLTFLTFGPIIGAALVCLLKDDETIRRAALIISLVVLFPGIAMVLDYNDSFARAQASLTAEQAASGVFVYEEKIPWIEAFNINYHMGVDGLSMPFIFLAVFLCPLCVLASWGIREKVKGYMALFLLLEGAMIGVFAALDLFLFFVFWELMLLPMYFLIGIWGGPRRVYAAIKFVLYTLFGSIFLFIAMLVLYAKTGSFSLLELPQLMGGIQMTWAVKLALFIGLYVAFAIKIPAFPFHTWLPDAHVEAPTAISVILAGILLKMGAYGLFRISYPIFPDAAAWFCTPMAVIGLINIVYGALCAMAQSDLKKLVAYSSISHMGYVMLGMAVYREESLQGAVFQMFNHGTITAMLFLLVGVIYDRAHHREIDGFGGLVKPMPVYGGITALAFFAALGLPGLSGFISETLVFLGAFQEQRLITCLSTSGILLGAAYMLWTYQRVFMGPVNEKYAALPEISLREICTLAPLAVFVIVLGIFPSLFLNAIDPTMEHVLASLQKGREAYQATLQVAGALVP